MSLFFDGVDDYINFGNPTQINDIGTGAFTIEAWIKNRNETISTDNHQPIVVKSTFDTGDWGFDLDSGHRLRFHFDGTSNISTTATGLNDRIWHHVAVTRDGATMKLYLDGVNTDTFTNVIGLNLSNAKDLIIGARIPLSANRKFKGNIDEVRIWNVARTQEQIQDTMSRSLVTLLYDINGQIVLDINGEPVYSSDDLLDPTLKAYWGFNQTSDSNIITYGYEEDTEYETLEYDVEVAYYEDRVIDYSLSGIDGIIQNGGLYSFDIPFVDPDPIPVPQIIDDEIPIITYSDYITHIQEDQTRIPRIKVEFLRYEDETVLKTITGDVREGSGLLNIERKNGQRRSISFDLTNVEGEYTPDPDKVWLRQKVKVYKGLIINGGEFWVSQGVFVMTNPVLHDMDETYLRFEGDDKFSLAETIGGEVEGTYIIPVDTSVDFAIRMILQPSTDVEKEVFYDPISPMIDSEFSTILTPYTIEVATGDNIASALYELAHMVSANMYYDAEGRFIFERDIKDNQKGSVFTLSRGDFNYIAGTRTYRTDDVYNACLVVGDNINGEIFDAYVENTNTQSPTSINNLGWKRVLVVTDPNIYTDELATIRAEFELRNVTIMLSSFSISCAPHILHLDVDRVITLTSNKLDVDEERVLIDSLSIPLSSESEITINCALTSELEFEPELV